MSTPAYPTLADSDSELGISPKHPHFCIIKSVAYSACGASAGSVFGYAAGILKDKGYIGSFADAGSSAKTFAVLAGVHSLVVCFLKKVRGKDDAINAGVSGCCIGLALNFQGAPQTLLQSCVRYVAFSFIMEGFNRPQPAFASPFPKERHGLLPPLALPLPDELKQSFSSFCQSIRK